MINKHLIATLNYSWFPHGGLEAYGFNMLHSCVEFLYEEVSLQTLCIVLNSVELIFAVKPRPSTTSIMVDGWRGGQNYESHVVGEGVEEKVYTRQAKLERVHCFWQTCFVQYSER